MIEGGPLGVALDEVGPGVGVGVDSLKLEFIFAINGRGGSGTLGGPPISLPLSLSGFVRLVRDDRRLAGGNEDCRFAARDRTRSRSSLSSIGDIATALIGTCIDEGDEDVEADAEAGVESIDSAARADVVDEGVYGLEFW